MDDIEQIREEIRKLQTDILHLYTVMQETQQGYNQLDARLTRLRGLLQTIEGTFNQLAEQVYGKARTAGGLILPRVGTREVPPPNA